MKLNELKNGDFVVLRSGIVGLVIINQPDDGYIVFDNHLGWEGLDNYDDNMIHAYAEDAIMQVYRNARGFNELVEETPLFERDETWIGPIDEAYRQLLEEAEKREAECDTQEKPFNKDLIHIVTQAFYGNRTGTSVTEDSLDAFVLGYLDNMINPEKKIDRTIVRLPGSECVVLIYNKYEEESCLDHKERVFREKGYTLEPLATIPEMNLEIYSRCIVCRMDSSGKLESLRGEDYKIWSQYLAE